MSRSKKVNEQLHNNNNNNNQNHNETVESTNGTRKLRISREIKQLMVVSIKCIGKLYFSVYLIHTVFVRYDWYSSRQLRRFQTWDNVIAESLVSRSLISIALQAMRGSYSVMHSVLWAYWFYLLFEAPFNNLRMYIKNWSSPPVMKAKSS